MLSTDSDILKAAEDWRKEGRAVALATVVETWGSAPRPVGANLVIDQDGNFLGSVSGGCVEGAVVTEALDVIELRPTKNVGIRRRRRDRLEGRPLLRRQNPRAGGEGGLMSFRAATKVASPVSITTEFEADAIEDMDSGQPRCARLPE